MAGENTIYDITADPGTGAFSSIENRETEFYDVSDSWPDDVPTPGFIGFQLDARPDPDSLELWIVDSDYLDTDVGVGFDSDDDGQSLEIITSGTPNSSQARLYPVMGWLEFHSDNLNLTVAALYDSWGSNYNRRTLLQLINDLGGGSIDDYTISASTDWVDTDVGLTANSDILIASQKATKTYVDNGRSVVYIKDIKSAGSHGGTFTAGVWQTRILNTLENQESYSWVTLSSNQITLAEGSYDIYGYAPGFNVSQHKSKLRNVTDAIDEIIGESGYSRNSVPTSSQSFLMGNLQVVGTKSYEIQHQCNTTVGPDGFGTASNFSVDEVYAQLKITKIV